jgi:hypothetical protein
MEGSTLLMPFLDESETFVLGFECGQIWQMLTDGEVFNGRLIHTQNTEQIKMICEAHGAPFSISYCDDTWSNLTVSSIGEEV